MVDYIFRLARRCTGVVKGALYGFIRLPDLRQYFNGSNYPLETPVEGINASGKRSFKANKGLLKKIIAH